MNRVDPEASPFLRVLLYGQPGSTKTRTAATAALDDRTYPCLMLEAGGNPISIRDYARKPDIIHIDRLDEFNPVFNWLVQGQKRDDPFCNLMKLKPPYKCVIVDSITEVQRISFNQQTGANNLGPGSFPARVERQHFGNTLAQMINFAKLFYSLPMHVILTSLEKSEKDEQTGSISLAPLLWGQSDTEVGGYAYVVARMVHRVMLEPKVLRVVEDPSQGLSNLTSIALFKPSGKYQAKDQYCRLGDFMADPSITKMLDLIYGPAK